jgi:hypothetical protein
MKSFIAILTLAFASATMAQPAKQPDPAKIAAKQETNCVTKDKKGNCPTAPKSSKPTPKKKAETTK